MSCPRLLQHIHPALVAAAALLLAIWPGGALAADDSHVVQEGETLSKIAADLAVDPDDLVRANALQDPDRLSVGQVLKLPAGPPRSHEVQEGDTLSSIAAGYGVTVEALVAANQLVDPNRLAVGQRLALPAGVAAPANAGAPQATPPPSLPQAQPRPRADRAVNVPYVVQAGDTLTSIARRFETSVEALLATSGLANPDRMAVGQTVQVPVKTLEHQVAPGETLAGIAARYTVDLGSLVDFNNLDHPNLIGVGDLIAIPRAATLGKAEPAPPPLVAASVQPASPPPAPAQPATPPPAPEQPKPAPAPARAPQSAAPAVPGGLAALAMRQLGRPYVWGGSSEAGFDCSGLVWYVAQQARISLSRGIFGQYNAGPHPERARLQPGDIVFFQNTYMPGLSHNGIYVGEGKFVHAVDEAQGVALSRLDDAYWASRWFGATRLS